MPDISDAAKYVKRNAVESLPEGGLEKKLELAEREDRPLRVKLGIDPTAPDIHLGHTVVLQKLREFQDAGHLVVLIIGDFTARVGDPSGQSAARPVLDTQEIESNAKTFQEQAFKVLDEDRTEVRHNSEWLDMSMEKLFRLTRTVTVAQVLERDDFDKRYKEGKPISLLETLYPVLQGYDSVAIDADIELGGTDQKFNLLMGRQLQQTFDTEAQTILTMPILPGTDGQMRMSKSAGNYIGVTEPSEEMFGKVMSIPDETMHVYYELLLGDSEPDLSDPNAAKRALGRELVARFHSHGDAEKAEAHFDRLHKERRAPSEIEPSTCTMSSLGLTPGDQGPIPIPTLTVATFGGEYTTSEVRRLIKQGGVRIDGEQLDQDEIEVARDDVDGKILQIGKRKYRRIHIEDK